MVESEVDQVEEKDTTQGAEEDLTEKQLSEVNKPRDSLLEPNQFQFGLKGSEGEKSIKDSVAKGLNFTEDQSSVHAPDESVNPACSERRQSD